MAIQKKKNFDTNQLVRYVAVGALTVAAFLGAYRFAQAKSASAESNVAVATGAANASAVAAANAAPGSAAAGGGGSCCGGGASTAAAAPADGSAAAAGGGCCGGGGGSNATVAGKTTVSGDVQRVTIDLTTGSYSPNRITAKAGVPLELVFKGPASGCNGQVVSQQLGFQQDVSNGGTIKVGALKAGNYEFSCSMGMYIGQIVVK